MTVAADHVEHDPELGLSVVPGPPAPFLATVAGAEMEAHVTNDQVERVITALERLAAADEERLKLQRQQHQRMEARMAAGPTIPSQIREEMERRRQEGPPPEVKQLLTALERIAAALDRGERLPGT